MLRSFEFAIAYLDHPESRSCTARLFNAATQESFEVTGSGQPSVLQQLSSAGWEIKHVEYNTEWRPGRSPLYTLWLQRELINHAAP